MDKQGNIKYKPGIVGKIGGALKNIGKTSIAGYKAGRAAGGGVGAMSQAYKKAGGGYRD